ncbi:hypothetical protein C8J56DRAFT_1040497 [Mycena floridula]|nr:hypothetical protein C8J56DRAFT_1040497 [Mycena floridula]
MPSSFMPEAAVQSFIITSSMLRALSSIASLLGQEINVDRMTSVLAILACSLGFWLRCSYDDPEHFWSYLLSFWVPALVAAVIEWSFDVFLLCIFAFQLCLAYLLLA